MNVIVKKILNKLTAAGYEAYLVGGFVRDYLIGINSLDVDICTNALPKDLHKIFPNNNNNNNYGGFNLQIKNYNIDITTYRKEIKYEKRKPVEIEYINNLEEDIKRRDFTINSICMDKDEKVIDLTGGVNDLNNHLIKMLGNIKERLTDDPLRILRAIRFATILNFHLDEDLYNAIKENYYLVSNLSDIRIKEELTKILLNKNYQKGLNLLKELKILDILKISFDDITYVNDISGMWAQLKIDKNYGFTKQEIRNIISIKEIINGGIIDNKVLYKYGLYNSLVAAEILHIDKKSVNKMMKKLPLENEKDLQIKPSELVEVLKIDQREISKIRKELINLILEGKLNNNNKDIKNYLKNLSEEL